MNGFTCLARMRFIWTLLLLAPLALAAGEHEHAHDAMPVELRTVDVALFFIVIVGFVWFFRSLRGKDLLEYKLVSKLFKSKWYPKIIQIPTLILFGFIIYYFFWGSAYYSNNPGSILAWTLWWPLVPLTFILFGRLWCTACPIPLIGDFIQRFVQPTLKPGRFIIKYGIWITDGLFIAITLFDRLYGMVDKPYLSGAVFLLMVIGVIVLSIRYERRTFCKHFCFLGGVSGNYSMLSGLSIEAKDRAVCASCNIKACYFGSGSVSGCPYANIIPAKQGMRNCTLCGNCVKACPHNNLALRVRAIASELWSHARVSFSESFFAKLMVGIVIIQNLGMLAVWANLQQYVMQFGIPEKGAIAILYAAAIAIPLLLMTVSSFISNKLQTTPLSTSTNFAAFGYAFIPIDVAGHIAHNAFHLLSEGKSVIGAFAGLFSGRVTSEGSLTSMSTISGLQFALILAGGIGTLYVAYRIARAREISIGAALRILLPHIGLLLMIIAVNIYLFTTPMTHRGG